MNVSPVGKSAFICTYVECALTVSEDSAVDTRRAAREDAWGCPRDFCRIPGERIYSIARQRCFEQRYIVPWPVSMHEPLVWTPEPGNGSVKGTIPSAWSLGMISLLSSSSPFMIYPYSVL
jgi:hypothetical protein